MKGEKHDREDAGKSMHDMQGWQAQWKTCWDIGHVGHAACDDEADRAHCAWSGGESKIGGRVLLDGAVGTPPARYCNL